MANKKTQKWMRFLSKELISTILSLEPKDIFYDVSGEQYVIFGIQLEDNTYGKGIALRSPYDEFDLKRGKNLAAGRAVRALINKRSSDPIRTDWETFPNNWNKREIIYLLSLAEIFENKTQYGKFE